MYRWFTIKGYDVVTCITWKGISTIYYAMRAKLSIYKADSALLYLVQTNEEQTVERTKCRNRIRSFFRLFDWNQIILFAVDHWVRLFLRFPYLKKKLQQLDGWSVKNVQFDLANFVLDIHLVYAKPMKVRRPTKITTI